MKLLDLKLFNEVIILKLMISDLELGLEGILLDFRILIEVNRVLEFIS